MRLFRITAGIALGSLIVVGAATPVNAALVEAKDFAANAAHLETTAQSTVWTPPETADDAVAGDSDAPTTPWEPLTGGRFGVPQTEVQGDGTSTTQSLTDSEDPEPPAPVDSTEATTPEPGTTSAPEPEATATSEPEATTAPEPEATPAPETSTPTPEPTKKSAPKKDAGQDSTSDSANRAPAGTPVGAPGLGSLSFFSFEEFAVSDTTNVRVNRANGNLVITANDSILTGPGVGLRVDRFYNGLSSDAGTFGAGWSSSVVPLDVGLDVSNPASVVFRGSSGIQATFAQNGTTGTFAAPSLAINATLTKDPTTGVYSLSYNRTGEVLTFNSTGYLLADNDRNGVGVSYSYDGNGHLATAVQASGRSMTFNWTGGVLTSMTDSSGRTTTYNRNAAAQLTGITSPDAVTNQFTYDSVGRLATLTVPAAGGSTVVTFAYVSATTHKVASVTEKSTSPTWGAKPDLVTSFTYNATSTIVTDALTHAATYNYDTAGRVTSTVDALSRTRSQTWSPNSDIATTTDALGSGSTPGNTSTYDYDALANTTGAHLPTGAAASAIYAQGADCPSASTGTTYQVKCSIDASGNSRKYDYDTAGNHTKLTDTSGGGTAVMNELTYSTGAAGQCSPIAGQVCTAKDGNGNITIYAYDASGNITSATPPAPLGATTYTYDSLGRVTSVTDGKGDTTSYGYDVRDRTVLTTFDSNQTVTTAFLPNGLKQSETDSAGGSKLYEYDVQGLLTKQQGPTSGLVQKFAYDKVGNLLTFEDSGGVVTYTYDAANQLSTVKEPGGTCSTGATAPAASSGCIKYTYNGNGAELSRTFPGGAKVTTMRDASGRPTNITSIRAGGAIAPTYQYSYTKYDAPDLSTWHDTDKVQTLQTLFDEQSAALDYTYDSRNRLIKASRSFLSIAQAPSWVYTYDGAGNRTSQVFSYTTGGPTITATNYAYNAANQLVSSTADTTTWTYDAAGNQTRNGITGVTANYGDRGQMTAIGGQPQTYFGEGNTERTASGSATNFQTSALGLSQQKVGTKTDTYTRSPNGDLISRRVGTERHYYIKDALGSVGGMFSVTGSYEGGYSYTPYGETRAVSTNAAVVANTQRYIAGQQDSGGLYKMGARYYDPSLGRFTQMDPSGQEKNPYGYANCNPIGGKDPTGLITECQEMLFEAALDLVGAALAATVAIVGSESGILLLVGAAGFGLAVGYFELHYGVYLDECA